MEIKPQELRSGNLLMGQPFNCARVGYGDGVVAITAYGIGLIESDPNFGKNFKPIELTPEWLTRLGWVWNPDCNSWEKYPNGDARMHLKFHDVSFSYTMFNYVLRATIAERIHYVHQLQNLFYALTGEELAIDKTSLKN